MKIYLDYIFLENLVVNIIVYLATIKLINIKIKTNKIIIFSCINSLLSCLCTVFNINNYLISFLFTISTIIIVLNNRKIVNILKCTLIYYLTYFIYIGEIIVFSILLNLNLNFMYVKLVLYLFCGVILNLCINNMWKMWKIKLTNNALFYNLKINNVFIPVFVDTGNTVKDTLSNLDVIFLSKKYMKDILKKNSLKKKNILICSINNIGFVEGFVVKNLEIYKENKKVAEIEKIIVSFEFNNTQEKYSGIIGYETYLKYLEGVKLC